MFWLAGRPVPVQMEFVIPHVKRGDYYLMHNRINGRRMYVYPRHMGERRYAVVMPMGSDGDTEQPPNLLSWLLAQPQQVTQQVEETQAELRRTQQLLQITVAASLIASGLVVWMALKKKD